MTPIIASPVPITTRPAESLRRLADALDSLTHARVSQPDVYAALNRALSFDERLAAFKPLSAYLDQQPGYEGWLDRWTGPRPRVEVVALVREAAEQAAQVTR